MDPERDPEGRNVKGDGVVSGKPLETDHNLNFLRLCSLGLKIRKETLQFSAKGTERRQESKPGKWLSSGEAVPEQAQGRD